jgi:hypothetical protein
MVLWGEGKLLGGELTKRCDAKKLYARLRLLA